MNIAGSRHTTAPGAPPSPPRAHRRIVVAMAAAGISTFAQLYAVQSVLPAIAATFDAGAAQVALTVSSATGGLAVSVLVWSGLADRFGHVRMMTLALTMSTALGLIAAHADGLWPLVVIRALQGAALGGVPAVAMAYLADRLEPARLTRAAGVYVAGTTIGGMSGRLVAGAVADFGGWRWGVGADAALGIAALAVFVVAIPRTDRPVRHAHTGRLAGRVLGHLRDRRQLALYAQALLLMGAFVAVYNYLGFRLSEPPFDVSQTVVAFLFVAYLAGTVGSAAVGRLVERAGRYPVLLCTTGGMMLGALTLLSPALPVVATGLVAFTLFFFIAHAGAAAWVGVQARQARAQASALYTLAYYTGSSVFGWLGGLVYEFFGWHGVVGYVMGLCAAAGLAGLALRGARDRPVG